MLPLAEAWYRKQLVAAVFLGVFGGLFTLAFSVITTWSIDRLFGDATSDLWSGEWWWIALTAGGAVLVTAMRKALTVPDEVPGAIAMAKAARVDPKLAPKLINDPPSSRPWMPVTTPEPTTAATTATNRTDTALRTLNQSSLASTSRSDNSVTTKAPAPTPRSRQ